MLSFTISITEFKHRSWNNAPSSDTTIVQGRGQAEGLSFSMQKRPPFCNPRQPTSLFLQRPCPICACCRAPGQQLFHIIFRKSNKRVLPAGFTNWMVLFQIKKHKQTWVVKGDRIYPLVSRKSPKSFVGSLLQCLRKFSNRQLRQGLRFHLLATPWISKAWGSPDCDSPGSLNRSPVLQAPAFQSWFNT